MFCKKCGKEIKYDTVFCPECGASQAEVNVNGFNNTAAVQGSTKNTLCIVGFVISIISIFLNFYGIAGIAGIIVSVIGLTDCKKKNQSGNKLAIAGIIIGVISVIYAFAVSMVIMAYLWQLHNLILNFNLQRQLSTRQLPFNIHTHIEGRYC